jgi:hypothetical protein
LFIILHDHCQDLMVLVAYSILLDPREVSKKRFRLCMTRHNLHAFLLLGSEKWGIEHKLWSTTSYSTVVVESPEVWNFNTGQGELSVR